MNQERLPAGRPPTWGSDNSRTRRQTLDRHRNTAKIGMTLSLGALVATGLIRRPGARRLHLWAGVALVGFSIWHHSLYPAPSHLRGNR